MKMHCSACKHPLISFTGNESIAYLLEWRCHQNRCLCKGYFRMTPTESLFLQRNSSHCFNDSFQLGTLLGAISFIPSQVVGCRATAPGRLYDACLDMFLLLGLLPAESLNGVNTCGEQHMSPLPIT